jgi:hypothetical protein
VAKVDLRKTLRAIGNALQDENVDRLLEGLTIDGASVAPRVTTVTTPTGRQKRVRIKGVRISLRDLGGRPGIASGAMLKDAGRRANVKVGRVSVKVVPSPAMRARWFAYMKGVNTAQRHQVARPVSGITDARMQEARDEIAREARNQFVKLANQRQRGT